ncbi:MAG: NAD(P)-binding domain-containing protein [Planctomycetota bacterium]
MDRTGVVVIGAGPIGIEVAAGLKASGLSYEHLEAGDLGATMGWWAPDTRFFSSPERIRICDIPLVIPGEEKATGEQYRDYLRGVVEQLGLRVRTHERVLDIEARDGGGFVVVSRGPAGGSRIACDSVVLATGNMDAPRLIGVPGEDLPHVSHYFRGPHHYYGRKVLIVGGKNSAAEAALRLYRAGVEVSISYRGRRFDPDRVKYWIRPELEWLIEKGKIGFLPCTRPVEIEPGQVRLERTSLTQYEECPPGAEMHDGQQERGEGVRNGLADVETHADSELARSGGRRVEVPADFVLLLTGYVQDQTFFERLELDLIGEERRPMYDHDTMETSVPGVYVAGTACGGSQTRARVFIENSHVHAERIVAALTGDRLKAPEPSYGAMEES